MQISDPSWLVQFWVHRWSNSTDLIMRPPFDNSCFSWSWRDGTPRGEKTAFETCRWCLRKCTVYGHGIGRRRGRKGRDTRARGHYWRREGNQSVELLTSPGARSILPMLESWLAILKDAKGCWRCCGSIWGSSFFGRFCKMLVCDLS